MAGSSSKELEILKSTEEMVRQGGYNAFSFRDVASAVGIKSSSVHYHFPTKEDLGAAVAKYYTDRFMDTLGEPRQLLAGGNDPITAYVEAFRSALINDKRMCLCGLLGAEIDGLPEAVVVETRTFFKRNLKWLTEAYGLKGQFDSDAHRSAVQTLAQLEGAMITSNVMDDISLFDLAAESLIEQ